MIAPASRRERRTTRDRRSTSQTTSGSARATILGRARIGAGARAGEPLELVLAIEDDDPDRERLLAHGWSLRPPELVATPERYRDYVAGSFGEFSCAKGGYLGTHSGWFGDRSASYLAAGRPVDLRATGFEDVLPAGAGAGAIAVRSADAAADAIAEARGDYARHRAAALELAHEFFDVERLFDGALQVAGIPRGSPL